MIGQLGDFKGLLSKVKLFDSDVINVDFLWLKNYNNFELDSTLNNLRPEM
eukprot:CAMPEP_0116961568 /NCGR_PEP_ID=MMETSP0467-20121206/46643_1 /TAXON_ID=283647 /ORGANISM="Mesodinium pulex, Strain SPMC105" /LENGTH=49 /DNA_ID=CAMNT_0004649531 /DNA_START=557 /DNA_END=706 /DNA_ORIENTATION=-